MFFFFFFCFFSFDIFEIRSAGFFGFLMRCGYADCSWDFWVLDFGIYVSEICLFSFHPSCDFCGTNFFIFQDSVWLVKKS